MSALTTEWQLKTGENSIKYTVVVEDFRQKINSFEAVQVVPIPAPVEAWNVRHGILDI